MGRPLAAAPWTLSPSGSRTLASASRCGGKGTMSTTGAQSLASARKLASTPFCTMTMSLKRLLWTAHPTGAHHWLFDELAKPYPMEDPLFLHSTCANNPMHLLIKVCCNANVELCTAVASWVDAFGPDCSNTFRQLWGGCHAESVLAFYK